MSPLDNRPLASARSFRIRSTGLLSLLVVLAFALSSCLEEEPTAIVAADPVITSIQPDSAYVGEEIIISGENFSDASASNTVTFAGGVQGTVVGAGSTSLLVVVPDGAITGKITVAVGGKAVESADNFTVRDVENLLAYLAGMVGPKVAAIGDTITIGVSGQGITDDVTMMSVKFGSLAVEVLSLASLSPTWVEIKVRVPVGAVSGPVTVRTRGRSANTDHLEIITPVLPFTNCVVEISGFSVEVRHRSSSSSPWNGDKQHDTVFFIPYSRTIDTRGHTPNMWQPHCEKGFINNNTFEFRYELSMTVQKNFAFKVELDPVDLSVRSLILSASEYEPDPNPGGPITSTSTTAFQLETGFPRRTPDANYEYEFTGDEVQAFVKAISYQHDADFSQIGHGSSTTKQNSTGQFQSPPTAKIKIRFME